MIFIIVFKNIVNQKCVSNLHVIKHYQSSEVTSDHTQYFRGKSHLPRTGEVAQNVLIYLQNEGVLKLQALW